LIILGAIVGYAAFQFGGVVPEHWNLCLLALGVLALFYWLRASVSNLAPPLDRNLRWLVMLLFAFVLFQVVPLPSFVLRVISPARADLLDGIAQAVPGITLAPLSVAPSETFGHFLRLAGYVLVFLLVREIAWRIPDRPWMLGFPIIFIASLEAGIGLLQQGLGEPGTIARGTFINRNHFAGLLGMALPLAVAYPVAVMRRVRARGHSPAGPAVKACLVMGLATALFLAVLYSLSRMGLVATLGSFLVMGILALSSRLSTRVKLPLAGVIALSVIFAFVFLAPDQLIVRFAEISSPEKIMASDRLLLWHETLDLVAAYPLFGCGLGSFTSAFMKYKVSEPLVTDGYVHNDYLQIAAELGLVGFAIAAVLVLTILAKAVRATWEHSDHNSRGMGLACTGGIVAILIHSLVDFNLYIPSNALVLAWIFGISAGLTFSRRKRSSLEPSPGPQVLDVDHQDITPANQ
jgi:O-antigen ligase